MLQIQHNVVEFIFILVFTILENSFYLKVDYLFKMRRKDLEELQTESSVLVL